MDLLKGEAMCVFVLLTFVLVHNFVYALKVMEIPGCKQSSTSLICNIMPKDIPGNVTHVYLQNVKGLCNIVEGQFEGSYWRHIKLLHISVTEGRQSCQQMIGPYAFHNLTGLEELAILSRFLIGLDNTSFAGLENLRRLTFTGCMRLRMESIIEALDGHLPKLEVLSLTYIDIYNGVYMDKHFFDVLSVKPIKQLNMNQMVIKEIILKHSKQLYDTLEVFNISGSTVVDINEEETFAMEIKHLKLFDISYTVFPKEFFGFIKSLPKLVSYFYTLQLEMEKVLSQIETVNVTGVNNHLIPIQLDNVTVYLNDTTNKTWYTEHVILQHNQFAYLNVIVPCNKSPLKSIDMSYNIIEFLQPNFCPCCSNLIRLNFEHNMLFKMARNNFSMFAHLTVHYTNLDDINLAQNKLQQIPKEMFLPNKRLRVINLSHNSLQQITFQVGHLDNLEVLDLRWNHISILNQRSIENLHRFERRTRRIDEADNDTRIINLDFNPISCSTCTSLDSISWLTKARIVNKQNLSCTNEKGQRIPVDQNAVNMVKALCNRPRQTRNTILISVLTPVSTGIALLILFCSLKRYRNKQKYKQRIEERLQLIEKNEMDTQYLVFLSFSSDDQDFVMENISVPLQERLQEMTKSDRDLVCIGDMHFQIGRPIHDEMFLKLSESAVILFVLSPHFCSSHYCRMEFDFALQLNKPIVLMIKDDVDPREMVPSLREMFYKRTRILWERQDNEYRLKTTWTNVCNSILELIEYN